MCIFFGNFKIIFTNPHCSTSPVSYFIPLSPIAPYTIAITFLFTFIYIYYHCRVLKRQIKWQILAHTPFGVVDVVVNVKCVQLSTVNWQKSPHFDGGIALFATGFPSKSQFSVQWTLLWDLQFWRAVTILKINNTVEYDRMFLMNTISRLCRTSATNN